MVRAVDVQAQPGGTMRFTVQRRNGVRMPDLEVTLNLPGEHNVLNALATIAVATELELPDAPVVKALAEPRRGPALPALRRGQRQGGRPFHADRRLRPPPGRDGRGAGGGARRLPGPAHRAGLPAAPLHAHARLLRGFRQGDGQRRRGAARRGLCRRRGAHRRPTARAGARGARGRAHRPGIRRRRRRHAAGHRRAGGTATWSSPWVPVRSAAVPAQHVLELLGAAS